MHMSQKVTKTSKQAYKKTKKKRISRCNSIMSYLNKMSYITGSAAASLLNIPRNEAAKRLSDLHKIGLIKKFGKIKNDRTKCLETIYTPNN